MKYEALASLLALAAAAPLAARAQDNPYRILSDPAYLPLAGQIFGATGYAYDNLNSDTTSADGTSHTHSWGSQLDQHLGYGLTNRLSFEVGIDYLVSHEHDTSPSGAASGRGARGFENPSLAATWRVIDQADHHAFNLDLSGMWAPDVFPAKTALPGSDGTVAYGGPKADVALAVSHVSRTFTIQANVTGRYVGRSTLFDRASGADIITQDYWVPAFGVATQTRITPRLSVNFGGGYNIAAAPEVIDVASGQVRRLNQGNFGDLNAAVNYHFVPNRLVGSIGYTHAFIGQNHVVFPADPALNTIVNRSTDTVGATLSYVFR